MARWLRRVFKKIKTHVYPFTLRPRLHRNWEARGFEQADPLSGWPKDWAYQEITGQEQGIGVNRMGFEDETWENFKLPGLTLSISVHDLETYMDHVSRMPERLELGRPYYKIYGDHHCICLLPQHYELLKKLLIKQWPKAKAIAEAEAVKFNRRFEEINKSPFVDVKHRFPEGKLLEV